MKVTSLRTHISLSSLALGLVSCMTARCIRRGSPFGSSKHIKARFNVKQPYRALAVTLTIILTIIGVMANSGLSWAGGSQAYTNGSEDFKVGKLPPPSLYYIHYANYYKANDFKDNDGDDVDEGPEVTTFANTSRLLWITDFKILGGNYATHIFVPIVYTDSDFDGDQQDSSQDKFGLGNIIFTPFLLGWQGKTFNYWINIADIFVPTRTDYDNDDAVNLGNNFWTIEPIVAFSWLPSKFEVTAKIMYDFSTKDTDHIVSADEASQLGRPGIAGEERSRQPGQEFHFDYVLGYHPNEEWELGVVGYFYQQMTDDQISGHDVNHRRGRVFAFGPGVKYNFEKLSLIGKVYYETLVKNRNEGIQTFFKLNYQF